MNINQSNHKPRESIAPHVHDRPLTFIGTVVSIILFKEQKSLGRTKYTKIPQKIK